MKAQMKNLHGTASSIPFEFNKDNDEEDSNPFASSSEEEQGRLRRNHRVPNHFQDFKVDVPEFKGWLDPNEFLEWLQTVERVFEYKDEP